MPQGARAGGGVLVGARQQTQSLSGPVGHPPGSGRGTGDFVRSGGGERRRGRRQHEGAQDALPLAADSDGGHLLAALVGQGGRTYQSLPIDFLTSSTMGTAFCAPAEQRTGCYRDEQRRVSR